MFLIVENFYNNPDEVRKWALEMEFNIQGNYPGVRTSCIQDPWRASMKKHFESLLNKKITYWPEMYNGAFQVTTESDITWVHHDATTWACVVFLTPDAPIDAGTGVYRHKESKIFHHYPDQIDYNEGGTTQEDWELVAHAGNIYNRAVIYHGDYYHRSIVPGFGTDKETGRLFQTFFFNAEN